MRIPTSIVIVRPEHLVSMRQRMADADFVGVFSESDLLLFKDKLLAQPPEIVLMHSDFAATSRGASLISALKSKQRDTRTAVRVFIDDEVKAPVLLANTAVTPAEALLETSRPLDRVGTRQAARYPMHQRPVAINGDPGQLMDLSVSGAQLQTAARLRPLKVARLVLRDATGDIHMQGTVAWAIAVPVGGSIQYRAGIEFVNPDKKQLTMFCTVYGGVPDPTLDD
jgi:hypothetical protein